MCDLRRLALLLAMALAAMAVAAASASATINDATTGNPYTGPISGTEDATQPAPAVGGVTCTNADLGGWIDGDNNLSELDFQWTGCSISGTQCAVSTVDNISFDWTESPATGGDAVLTNTEAMGTRIDCLAVFTCVATATADSTGGTGPVTGYFDSGVFSTTAQDSTIDFDDNVTVTGTGCETPGTWTITYTVSPSTLYATG